MPPTAAHPQKHDSHAVRPADQLLSNTLNAEVLGAQGKLVICNFDSFAKKEISYFPYQNVHIVIIVADMTSPDSIKHTENWFSEAKRYSGSRLLSVIVVGAFPTTAPTTDPPQSLFVWSPRAHW